MIVNCCHMGALVWVVCAFLTIAAYDVAAVPSYRPTFAGALACLLQHSQPGCHELLGACVWQLYAEQARGQ